MERMLRTIWLGRLLEGEVQAPLAAPAGGVDEVRGQAGLAGARRARDQDAAAAVDSPAAEHRVQPRDAAWRSARADAACSSPSDVIGRTEMPRSSMRNGYSLVPCDGAAVLDDAQPARGELLGDPVVEQDHAVGDVLLEALAGERRRRRARR